GAWRHRAYLRGPGPGKTCGGRTHASADGLRSASRTDEARPAGSAAVGAPIEWLRSAAGGRQQLGWNGMGRILRLPHDAGDPPPLLIEVEVQAVHASPTHRGADPGQRLVRRVDVDHVPVAPRHPVNLPLDEALLEQRIGRGDELVVGPDGHLRAAGRSRTERDEADPRDVERAVARPLPWRTRRDVGDLVDRPEYPFDRADVLGARGHRLHPRWPLRRPGGRGAGSGAGSEEQQSRGRPKGREHGPGVWTGMLPAMPTAPAPGARRPPPGRPACARGRETSRLG